MKTKNVQSVYKEAMAPLLAKIEAVPWEDQGYYANWLSQTYYFVSKSTRLIGLTGSMFWDNRLHHRFIDHAREERNHEILLVNDLKHMGLKIENYSEFPVTAGFYQAQAYWILLHSPMAFFGYILSLEGLAVDYGKQAFERAKNAHGPKAANFLKVHAEEDVEHLQQAFQLLEGANEHELDVISQNLKQSAGLYTAMLAECESRSATLSKSKVLQIRKAA